MFKLVEVTEEVQNVVIFSYGSLSDANSFQNHGDVIWFGDASYYVNLAKRCVMRIEEIENDIPETEPEESESES